MTYQQFRDKYNGQYLDYDGSYGSQCWDLAQYYNVEVLNVPDYVLSGCGYVNNMLYPPKRADLDAYFDEIDVHTMGAGDVCIWDNPTPHIAIFDHWDGNQNWYFSQNPNPCQIMTCGLAGELHAFRRKSEIPPAPEPTPVITNNVERDEYKNQIEVKVTELRVRKTPGLNGEILGYANVGFYNFYETKDVDGYTWYKIAEDNWIAYNEEWEVIYPKKEDVYVSFKVLNEKDGYKEIDLGKVYIKD